MIETLLHKKLVSVVVTSYNHAEYLNNRLESLLAQTYGNIESMSLMMAQRTKRGVLANTGDTAGTRYPDERERRVRKGM